MPMLAVGLLLGLLAAAPAQATTYRVAAADRNPDVAKYNGGHAFWFPGNGLDTNIPNGNSSKFVFMNDSGRLNVSDDLTTAHLTGTIQSKGDHSSIWDVDIMFILGMDYDIFAHGHSDPNGGTHDGQANRALHLNQYTDNGGTIDTQAWRYFYMDESQATLTGSSDGDHDGVTLDLYQRPNGRDYGKYVFQMGVGANGKNLNLGFSGWLGYTTADLGDQDAYESDHGEGLYDGDFEHDDDFEHHAYWGVGDINVELTQMPDLPQLPEPASLGMILMGLGVITLNARRRET